MSGVRASRGLGPARAGGRARARARGRGPGRPALRPGGTGGRGRPGRREPGDLRGGPARHPARPATPCASPPSRRSSSSPRSCASRVAVSSTRLVLTRGEAGRVIEALRAGGGAGQLGGRRGGLRHPDARPAPRGLPGRGAGGRGGGPLHPRRPARQADGHRRRAAGRAPSTPPRPARRRRALERESQLHGAMDGALKFVKGDAVAGVAIVLVNAVGGLAAGLAAGHGARRRGAPLRAPRGGRRPGLAGPRAPPRRRRRRRGHPRGRRRPERRLAASRRELLARAARARRGRRPARRPGRSRPGFPAAPFLAIGAALAGDRHPRACAARRRRRAAAGRRRRSRARGRSRRCDAVVVEISPDLAGRRGEDGEAWLAGGRRGAAGATCGAPWASRPAAIAVRAGARRPGQLAPARRRRARRRRGRCPPTSVALPGAARRPAPGRDPGGAGAPPALRRPGLGRRGRERGARGGARPGARPAEPGRSPRPTPRSGARPTSSSGSRRCRRCSTRSSPRRPALVREVARQVSPVLLAEVLRRLLEEGVSIRPLRPILEALLAAPAGRAGAGPRRRLPPLALPAHRPPAPARARARGAAPRPGGGAGVPRRAPRRRGAARAGPGPRAARVGGSGRSPPRRAHAALLAPGDVRRPLRDLVAQRFPGLAVLAYDELPPDLEVRPVGRAAFCE